MHKRKKTRCPAHPCQHFDVNIKGSHLCKKVETNSSEYLLYRLEGKSNETTAALVHDAKCNSWHRLRSEEEFKCAIKFNYQKGHVPKHPKSLSFPNSQVTA